LPDSKWPPLYRPQAILRPISHPTIGQQPPSQPRTAEPDSTPAGPSNDPMPTAGPSELTLRAQVPTNYRFAAAPVEIFQTLGGNPRLAVYEEAAASLNSVLIVTKLAGHGWQLGFISERLGINQQFFVQYRSSAVGRRTETLSIQKYSCEEAASEGSWVLLECGGPHPLQEPMEPIATAPNPPARQGRQLPTPAHSATIVGPCVGESGSAFDNVLRQAGCPSDWRPDNSERHMITHLSSEAVVERLAGKQLILQSISCPSCKKELGVQLPSGVSTVQCDTCKAWPIHIIAPPMKEKPQSGSANASHHGPPKNPARTGRPPTAWNKFVQSEAPKVLAEAKAAGEPISSKKAMQLAGERWPSIRDAETQQAASGAQPGTRRARRAPADHDPREPPVAAPPPAAQRRSRPPPSPNAPNSREAHVRHKGAAAASHVRCPHKDCPLVRIRVSPREMWARNASGQPIPPICDEV